MGKVTSKLQVTVPKAIADRYGIRPGDEIEWVATGDLIRVVPARSRPPVTDRASRLALFDEATRRARRRARTTKLSPVKGRGWRREDLYERARPR